MGDELSVTGPGPDDDELATQAGIDRAAFAALYDRYYPRVLKYGMRRLFDREAAEDVTSSVFLTVASQIQTLAGKTESDFRRWLFRIATNSINAHLRQTLRRKELWQTAAQEGRLVRDGEASSSQAADDALDWPAVSNALLELSERDQTIVTLRFFASLSHEEIADVVQATPGAVRTALSRALQTLRERLTSESRRVRVSGEFLRD